MTGSTDPTLCAFAMRLVQAERYRKYHPQSAYAGQFAPLYPGTRQGRLDWTDRVLQPDSYTAQWAREAGTRVCVCGDTASAHSDGGLGGCWPCACSRFRDRADYPHYGPGLNYGFRYTGD